MKKIVFLALAMVLVFASVSFGAWVHGYWRDTDRDGVKDTWVQPYQRTYPNGTRTDNYNYPGNYNPNKGIITPGDPYNNFGGGTQRRGQIW